MKRSKLGFPRQIWHWSKALNEVFPSVPLVLLKATFLIKNWNDNGFPNSNQIKSWTKVFNSNHITRFWKSIKSNHVVQKTCEIKSTGPKIHSNQIKSWFDLCPPLIMNMILGPSSIKSTCPSAAQIFALRTTVLPSINFSLSWFLRFNGEVVKPYNFIIIFIFKIMFNDSRYPRVLFVMNRIFSF